MIDCLLETLEDLRAQGGDIPLYDAYRRECWFDALAQLIVELRSEDRRMAWVALVAHDLCLRVPGLPPGGGRGAVVGSIEGDGGEAVSELVDHPQYYGGKDNPYEAIKVIEAWGLGFCLGNTVKYLARAGKKSVATELEDLKKARWYLDRAIQQQEGIVKP